MSKIKESVMPSMTSRERVLRTVNFQETDRTPIDLGGMKASSINVRAYNQLKARLDIAPAKPILPGVPIENAAALIDAIVGQYNTRRRSQ